MRFPSWDSRFGPPKPSVAADTNNILTPWESPYRDLTTAGHLTRNAFAGKQLHREVPAERRWRTRRTCRKCATAAATALLDRCGHRRVVASSATGPGKATRLPRRPA